MIAEFVNQATELARIRKVGDPFADGVLQGPQIDEQSHTKIQNYVTSAVDQGAKLKTGGHQWGKVGFFFEPTVFSDVTENMTIAQEEVSNRTFMNIKENNFYIIFVKFQIFGPVQSILKFKSLDEVIERANQTSYGLAAGIVTKNIDAALTFAQAVEAGSVWVNCYDAVVPQAPFGGYKQSGHGREL